MFFSDGLPVEVGVGAVQLPPDRARSRPRRDVDGPALQGQGYRWSREQARSFMAEGKPLLGSFWSETYPWTRLSGDEAERRATPRSVEGRREPPPAAHRSPGNPANDILLQSPRRDTFDHDRGSACGREVVNAHSVDGSPVKGPVCYGPAKSVENIGAKGELDLMWEHFRRSRGVPDEPVAHQDD